MKIYISYFYQIRFFQPNMIPLSTAVSDPKWYHDRKNKYHKFVDANGILNGSRAENLVLSEEISTQLADSGHMCQHHCQFTPPACPFMNAYRQHLHSLDFNSFINSCQKFSEKMAEKLDLQEEPIIILIVHEPPTVKCSERVVLREWFNEHNMQLDEWRKPNGI